MPPAPVVGNLVFSEGAAGWMPKVLPHGLHEAPGDEAPVPGQAGATPEPPHYRFVPNAGALLADMIACPGKYVIPEDLPDPIREAARKEEKKTARAAEEERIAGIAERLRALYARMQSQEPEAFAGFLRHVNEEREKFRALPLFKSRSSTLKKLLLGSFDAEEGRVKLFVQYFNDEDCPLPEVTACIGSTPEADIKRALDRLK